MKIKRQEISQSNILETMRDNDHLTILSLGRRDYQFNGQVFARRRDTKPVSGNLSFEEEKKRIKVSICESDFE